ncbi:carbohydrate ABC transporter permease [Hungatella effluvii]|uniref:carbohydrate ABC transporter permease n=1 Tax=Hungatella effluvii TaxID=1096246 RepID=UPI002A7F75AD|nr:carbohydrate ABC transporter permease [Hungatella effluvii]
MKKEKDVMSRHQGIGAGIVKAMLWVYSSFAFLILIYIAYNSLRPRQDILGNTFGKPARLSLANYSKLLFQDHFLRYFANSVIVLVISLVLLVLISSFTAYGISRYRFKGKKFMRIYFLIGLMFPVQLGIVPVFQLMKQLHLVNSLGSVILVSAAGISMPVFMLTDFFSKLPKEIYEAAVIDGAGEWTAFFKIMFPMATPVVFSVCITSSVQICNQFFLPLIFLQKDEYKTLPLLVVKYTNKLINTMDLAMAASALSTIPILILFMIFSRRILDGVTSGAVKG